MTDAPPTRRSRLRPFAGMFDLRMNANRFGLKRRTFKRKKSTESQLTNKRKISLQMQTNDLNNNTEETNQPKEETVKRQAIPIFAVQHKQISDSSNIQKWIQTKQPVQNTTQAIKPTLYDGSKSAQFMNLTEESLFEVFNHLTLNELCNATEVSDGLKLAAGKYFEIQYSRVNLAWLIEDGADKFTLHQARRLLQCFGKFISTLIVNTTQLEEAGEKEKLMDVIGQHLAGVLFWDTN